MANYEHAYKLLELKEFSGSPHKFLHRNKTEDSITLGGIYRSANPHGVDWSFVDRIMMACESNNISEMLTDNVMQNVKDMQRASTMLYHDIETKQQVKDLLQEKYWDSLRLGEVQSNLVAMQIMLFGVVSGIRNAAKIAQRVAQVLDDGHIGDISIRGINNYEPMSFYNRFRELELEYYDNIIAKDDDKSRYREGWYARGDILDYYKGLNL